MPDLLLELFSEEIPARMQNGAARDLERLMVGALTDRGLLFDGIKGFGGPRRLTLAVTGLPAKQPDVREEKKGPRVGAPEKAIEGFLRGAGVTLDQCQKQDDGKGEFYVAVIARKGRETPVVLAEILPTVLANLPWPKSMRWLPGQTVRWVRPLRSILCTFDGEVVPFGFAGVTAGNTSIGHRFLSQGTIEVRRFEDYADKLRAAHVVLDVEDRKAIILKGAEDAAFIHGLELIPDEGLLGEVAGLAEWPLVLLGSIEERFMTLPPEVLQTSMRTHQKYFALRDPKTGKMASRFALVANMIAADGGAQIVAGNERVLRARLSDAQFFWDEDRKRRLESRIDALNGIVFHAKLGTQHARMERIAKLAGQIAPGIGADPAKAERAARLAKADLSTGMVGEFPELQGVMGRYYALHDGEDSVVADAIRDHYRPMGPGDAVPTAPVSVALALADKLDALTGFFAAGEKPTGSGDPFALRRAALGVIRIILENRLRLTLGVSDDLLAFFADRLKVALKEKGIRHDLIDAVFSLGHEDDLVRLVVRVDALQAFLKTDDGANLLAGYKRAANILKVEEKKDKKTFISEIDETTLVEPAEKALAAAIAQVKTRVGPALASEDFAGALSAMAGLRVPVDAFFEGVTVNDADTKRRANRLNLLAGLRTALHGIADFSRIEG